MEKKKITIKKKKEKIQLNGKLLKFIEKHQSKENIAAFMNEDESCLKIKKNISRKSWSLRKK